MVASARPGEPSPAAVRVEVLVLSARLGALHYRSRSTDAVGGRHPDTVAAELAISPVTILHSTSWRFVDGQVVLTYAAVLDGVPDPWSRRLLEHGIATSGDPASPSPPEVCPDAVATHAARHLAWLRGTDAAAGAALAGVPAVWAALDRFEPAPAGAAPLSLRGVSGVTAVSVDLAAATAPVTAT